MEKKREIQLLTLDLVREIQKFNPQRAMEMMKKYHDWRKRSKRRDFQNIKNQENKIYRFLFPERVKEATKKYYEKNKEKLREQARKKSSRLLQCQNCYKWFSHFRPKRYCSGKCRRRFDWQRNILKKAEDQNTTLLQLLTVKCGSCGKVVEKRHSSKKYCGVACREREKYLRAKKRKQKAINSIIDKAMSNINPKEQK